MSRLILFVFVALAPVLHAESLSRKLDDVVLRYAEKQQFMGAILVARDKEILLDKAYGFANIEWNVPNTADTRFRIGSLTKQFTATAVLLLEERGLLKVGDKANKYLKVLPSAWDQVTIYNLLTHTSGIVGYTDLPDYTRWQGLKAEAKDLFGRIRDKPLKFAPGTRMEYSNSNYLLLGAIVEGVSRQRYGDFLRDNIFARLGMESTGYYETSLVLPRRAAGYSAVVGGPLVNAPHIDMSVAYAAGGLYSTTHDLLKWQLALFGGKVLAKASLDKMLSHSRPTMRWGSWSRNSTARRSLDTRAGFPALRPCLHTCRSRRPSWSCSQIPRLEARLGRCRRS